MALIKGYRLNPDQYADAKNADGTYTIQRKVPKQNLTKKQRHAIRMAQKEQKKNDTFDWLADAKERGDHALQEAKHGD